ncbi:uncharacterized protein si:dkey-19a16.7 isoform X3 [Danio rerio]|uniref:Uncharacterized protein si:dkey-19a16.7 isoform X3 n=1 Tax=Danio rerio TaxID=7955 RepID=A0AC58IGA7_DANRE
MFGSFVTRCLLCVFLLNGLSFTSDPLLVKEGQSVTLCSNINLDQNDIKIMWYFDDVRIADINAVNNGKTCLNDQCKTRFSDRLKLHQQTGSLIITNTRTTDSGDYKLMITGNDNYSEKIFSVSVSGVPGTQDQIKKNLVRDGESVTINPDRSSAAVARIHFVGAAAAAVLLLVAVVIIIVKWRKTRPYSGAISAVESESS